MTAINKNELNAVVDELQKFTKGMIFLSKVFDELASNFTEEQMKKIPSFADILDEAYPKRLNEKYEYKISLKTASKVEFFNKIAQYYRDVGMEDKAEETLQKCTEWQEKYSFDLKK